MTGIICGYVVATDGSPLPGVSVAVHEADGPVPDIAALTGDDGMFVLGGLPPGGVTLQAHLTNGRRARTNVQIVANSTAIVTIVIDDGGNRDTK